MVESLGMALELIGTFAGIPFYSDVELTEEEVNANYLSAVEQEKARLEAVSVVPFKAVYIAGKVFVVPEDPADDPRLTQ